MTSLLNDAHLNIKSKESWCASLRCVALILAFCLSGIDSAVGVFSYILTVDWVSWFGRWVNKVVEGAHCEIWFAPNAFKVYSQAPANDKGRINRILGTLSDNGSGDFTDKQFKSEGRHGCGGGKTVLVWAAKSNQLRLYGFFIEGSPRKFICPEGAIKKTNKADQKQLKRVAQRAGEYSHGHF